MSIKDYSGYKSFNNDKFYDPLTMSPNGMRKTASHGNVSKIECVAEISLLEDNIGMSNEELQLKLVRQFAGGVYDELVRDPSYFHCIDRIENPDRLTTQYRSTILIAQSKHDKYLNMSGNTFIVQDQHFTNDDLIQAVKNTFPERFI